MANPQNNQQTNLQNENQGQSGTYRKDPKEQDNRQKMGAHENNEEAAQEYQQQEAERKQQDRERNPDSRNEQPPTQAGKR